MVLLFHIWIARKVGEVEKIYSNAQMVTGDIKRYCAVETDGEMLLIFHFFSGFVRMGL
jgi:hypothetical protein